MTNLGSGLVDHSQKITVAARARAKAIDSTSEATAGRGDMQSKRNNGRGVSGRSTFKM